MALTHTDLLQGAVYATEQAGLFLQDAMALYRKGRYSSALALAVFCREELGRAQILFELRREALVSGPVNRDHVIEECTDHIEKLRRGKGGTTLQWGPEHRDKFKGLFMNPRSEEYKKAHALADELIQMKRKREPREAHEARLRALYVEPSESGGWSRPCEFTEKECEQFLGDVANDYALRCDQLQHNSDEELERAIAQWKDRPHPPRPIRP